jgi:hypothetical protein
LGERASGRPLDGRVRHRLEARVPRPTLSRGTIHA